MDRPNESPQSNEKAGAASRPRPLERTLAFLRSEIDRHGKTRKRLPTIREIATRLDVSPRTVQKAFNRLSAEARIETFIGRGTFTRPAAARASGPRLNVALNIDLDRFEPGGAWAYTIYGAILRASMASSLNAVFTSVEDAFRPSTATPPDGIILLPERPGVAEKVARDFPGTPTVFLDPPASGPTANFVSPDYNRLGLRLGEVWKECGKQRIVFFHHFDLPLSLSHQLQISGLVGGLGAALNDLEYFHTLRSDDYTGEAAYRAMGDYLSRTSRPPDAVLCTGDFLALGSLRALREAGVPVPEETSVIGGSGLDLWETECPQLTRCRQPFQRLGAGLFEMLLTRIRMEGASVPGVFIPVRFIGGATTSPAENERLLPAEESAALADDKTTR